MNKTHQAVAFTENSLAVTALLAVFTISIFTVVSLNPVALDQSESNVAGASTEKGSSVQIQNTYSQSGHQSKLSRAENGDFEIEIVANALASGSYSVDFARIENLENTPKELFISTRIEGAGRENLNLLVEKDSQKVLIYQDGKISSNKIGIKANEINKLKLRFDLAAKLNFPIKLIFTFSS